MQLYSRMVSSCYLWRRYKAVGPGTRFKLASGYFPSRPSLATTMEVNPKKKMQTYTILKILAVGKQLRHPQMSMTCHTQFSKSPRHILQHDQHSCPAHQPVLQNSLHKQLQIGVCLNKLDQTLYNFHMYVWDCSEHQQHQPGYKMVCCHRDSQTDQAQIQHTEHYPGRLVHFLDHRKHWRRLGHLKSCK